MNNKVDYTLLRPDATRAEVLAVCQIANDKKYRTVCVNPYWIRDIREEFEDLPICCVISFPYGALSLDQKMGQVIKVLHNGANVSEVDIVINLGLVRGTELDRFRLTEEIKTLTRVVHNNHRIVKFIVEATLWNVDELLWLMKVCAEAKADFIKTSTGTIHSKFTQLDEKNKHLEEIIQLWDNQRKTHNYQIKIKASGGIKTRAQAEKLIELGADRIGTSSEL